MIYLADTNVLLRFARPSQPGHAVVRTAVRTLRQNGHQILIASQNCVECWNVATRPITNNGLRLSTVEANRMLGLIERLFQRPPDTDQVFSIWRKLVVSFGVSGRQVFDARLVAAMQSLGVTHILTFNTQDFVRYANIGIVAIDPSTV
ncbi:MAG: type II toxin-antitoxin system VapC family toxin [Blastocatellia bacterium]